MPPASLACSRQLHRRQAVRALHRHRHHRLSNPTLDNVHPSPKLVNQHRFILHVFLMDAQAEIEDKLRLERETIARASETCERNQQSLQDIANDGIGQFDRTVEAVGIQIRTGIRQVQRDHEEMEDRLVRVRQMQQNAANKQVLPRRLRKIIIAIISLLSLARFLRWIRLKR
mmetsp:Transcript_7949/g.12843  ORF Transcript_7949/g.12843 Transcript_7949/m.12843 type:complete len:172 (-) Transcript_7949:2992-3507(-)